jgi:zinc transport system permease protein
MIEHILQYEFLQNAFLSGVLVGIICPIIGVFLVVRRFSLIADTLSHVALSGIATGLFLQKYTIMFQSVNPVYVGMVFSVGGSFIIEQFRKVYRFYQEIALPIVLSASVGFSVILISLADGFNADLFGYLFGSLIAVSRVDLYVVMLIGVAVIAIVLVLYKELFYLSFDEEGAAISGISKSFAHHMFIVMVALVIGVSMNIVGVLLVSSLLTLPVATSLQLARSFKQVFGYAIIFAQLAVIGGLVISYYFNLSTGGTIVVLSSGMLVVVIGIKKLFSKVRSASEVKHG